MVSRDLSGEAIARASFDGLWSELLDVGRDPGSGGYRRFAWTAAEAGCREWFRGAAGARGLEVETDRNGNLWARTPGAGADPLVVTGSHLDSVPDGGAFDGPLGIATAFAALDVLVAGGRRSAPLAIVAFSDEEGARFGVPCIGSRLLAGALEPDQVRALRDVDGVTLAEAMRAAGADPAHLGADPELMTRIRAYVELHVEQGRALAPAGAPIGVGTRMWPHGRWRLRFTGAADHAGTTALRDRRDPMLPFAATVLRVRELAAAAGARATIGRVQISPNATNAIAAQVDAWLDVRAAEAATVEALVDEVLASATRACRVDGTGVELVAESISPEVVFGADLTQRLVRTLAAGLGNVPQVPTGAGHDAGILAAAGVPAAMLYVRNPTGISHAPDEHAEAADCHVGVLALADVLADLLSAP
ncbi:MAG: allantoate amidohydrolase [Sporichthyaceae bacterium]